MTTISASRIGGTGVGPTGILEQGRALRARWLATLSSRQRLLHVAITSGLGLYFELLYIRWLESEVRHLAYVKNLPLLAAFLGLGLGFAVSGRRRSTYPLAIAASALVLGTGLLMGTFHIGEVAAGSVLK